MQLNLNVLWTICLLGSFISLHGQTTGSRNEGYKSFGTITKQLNLNSSVDLTKIKGSPYYQESFRKGKIVLKDKNQTIDADLRYNAFNDEFEVKEDLQSDEISAIMKSSNLEIFLDNKHYIVRPFIDKGTEKQGYFIVINSDKGLGTYERNTKVFVEGKKASDSFHIDFPPSFSDESDLYYEKEGFMVVYPKTKKDIAELFSDHEKELVSFIKKEKLNPKEKEDLIQIINYYNSLN